MRVVSILCAATIAGGCANVPKLGKYASATGEKKRRLCSDLNEGAKKAASTYTIFGWGLAIPAAAGIAAGPLIGEDPARKTVLGKHPGFVVTTSGALIGVLAYYMFNRANSASDASAAAARAHKLSDANQSYEVCVDAMASWIESRRESLDSAQGKLQYYEKKEETKEAITELLKSPEFKAMQDSLKELESKPPPVEQKPANPGK